LVLYSDRADTRLVLHLGVARRKCVLRGGDVAVGGGDVEHVRRTLRKLRRTRTTGCLRVTISIVANAERAKVRAHRRDSRRVLLRAFANSAGRAAYLSFTMLLVKSDHSAVTKKGAGRVTFMSFQACSSAQDHVGFGNAPSATISRRIASPTPTSSVRLCLPRPCTHHHHNALPVHLLNLARRRCSDARHSQLQVLAAGLTNVPKESREEQAVIVHSERADYEHRNQGVASSEAPACDMLTL
jgi:hypothetical protein